LRPEIVTLVPPLVTAFDVPTVAETTAESKLKNVIFVVASVATVTTRDLLKLESAVRANPAAAHFTSVFVDQDVVVHSC
jgi:hypothetical protein